MPRSLRKGSKKLSVVLKPFDHYHPKVGHLNTTSRKGIKDLGQVAELSRPNAEFYNSREWIELSASFRDMNPYCFKCDITGVRMVADHIIEINDAPERKLDPTNLQTLCYRCHAIKTAHEKRRRTAQRIREERADNQR